MGGIPNQLHAEDNMASKMIVSHDPHWEKAYADEASALEKAFGLPLQRMDHIGGTSLSGVFTKPIIDILVQLASFDDEPTWTAALNAQGYDARGEYGIAGRRYFTRKLTMAGLQGYHVHVYTEGSHHLRRHRAFCAFLARHPETAQAYSELKRGIADASGRLPDDYAARKSQFVERIEAQALAAFAKSPL
jgi:GrpB-like predicted nucleotidyltransferase (UPF0157 family)